MVDTSSQPLANTTTGRVQGIRDSQTGVLKFLGIPYAEPPVGTLRFQPTVPVRPWSEIRRADRFGAASAQVFDPKEAPYEEFVDEPQAAPESHVGSEDSLTLNVWTPGIDAARRPVLVWIHGGANWLESSRLSAYHGDRFAARGDVVFVSLNYRLGMFGFLDVSVLGGPRFAGSHSHGLRDQLTALEWIRSNMCAFGGDPDNITLMGESAGSIDISWLLTTGRLRGLIRRIVMMSGVARVNGLRDGDVSPYSQEAGRGQAAGFLARIRVRSMNELLSLSTAELLTRHANLAATSSILFDMDTLFYPRVDAAFTRMDPFRAARSGLACQDIDLMIGYTSYEMGLWLMWDDELDQRPLEWAVSRLNALAPRLRRELADLYATTFRYEPEGVPGMHLLGDAVFTMPSMFLADEWSRHNGNVWMYQFDWEANPRARALHAADTCFMFDKLDTATAQALLGAARDAQDAAERQRLSCAFQDAVLAFARAGDPASSANSALPDWPRYGAGRRVMRLNIASRVENDPLAERREWWTRNVHEPGMVD